MKALIFAAGLGTRLKPLTDSIPKALVPVGGVPMLERVIVKFKAAGFTDIVVNTCHFADKVESFLAEKDNFGIGIRVSREPGPEPFETGGGIRFARALLEDGEPFLAYNVDILSDVDLEEFVRQSDPTALANLLVTAPRAADDRFFLFDGGMRLSGWTNIRTGAVRGLPGPDSRRMSFCGIHLISPAIFPLLESWPGRFSITDFYIESSASQRILGIEAKDLNLIDIGSPEALARAEESCTPFSV